MKKLFKFLIKISLIFLLIFILLLFLVGTEKGSRFLLNTASKISSRSFNYDEFSGKLISTFTLKNLHYHSPQLTVNIGTIEFSWSPHALIYKKVLIDDLKLADMNVNLITESNSAKNSHKKNNFSLIKNVMIENGKLSHAVIKQNSSALVTISDLSWQSLGSNGHTFDIVTDKGKLQGTIDIDYILSGFSWRANLTSTHVNASLFNPNLSSDINFALQSEGNWDGNIKNMFVHLDNVQGSFQHYPLAGFADLNYANEQLTIKKSEIKIGDAILNVKGKLSNQYDLSWRLSIPRLSSLLRDSAGTLTSEGIISGTKLKPNIKAHLFAKKIKYADMKMHQASAELRTDRHDNNKLHLSFVAENFHNDYVTIPNFEANALFFISEVSRSPRILADINVHHTTALISSIKGKLTAITAQGSVDYPSKPLQFDGTFMAGEGAAKFSGKYEMADPNHSLLINIEGKDLKLINMNEYQVTITPTIAIGYQQGLVNIEGDILIPFANLHPKDFSDTLTLPSEVIFVDQGKEIQSLPTNLQMNIKLKLGDNISLQYRNLKAKLGGDLTIKESSGTPMTAVGALYTINGTYKAFDNVLVIENGRLIYSGNEITNPGLDIRAAKEIIRKEFSGKSNFDNNETLKAAYTGNANLKVGVWVTGNLEKPFINFYSTPGGISQNDILSYLIFGYPQSEISKGSSLALLNSLAAEMNIGGGGDNKIDKFKKSLGLNEFGIGSTDVYDPDKQSTEKKTTVTMGKKLGRKLYVRYSVGLLDSLQILNLKYQLSKRLSVQSETSSTENGADILYEIEKD